MFKSIYICSNPFTFIRNNLHSFTIIYIHSQSSTFTHNQLHSLLVQNYLQSCLNFYCLKVHDEITRCLNKEEGVRYPTTKSLHDKIMKIDGLWKWSEKTTYHLLRQMGFA